MIGCENNTRLNRTLQKMFIAVPRRYDLVNRIITWGLDKHWRLKAAKECLAVKPEKILDICCGTGDLAINLARLDKSSIDILGLDYSYPMLAIAVRKGKAVVSPPAFVYGDAANLPFSDERFDCIGISFAFRNLSYKNPMTSRYLAEILRVLSMGGRFVIVESSQPRWGLIRKLYRLYLRWFVFPVGALLSDNRSAYRYLAESAARFYNPEELKELLLTAGFKEVSFQRLFLGAASIHVAIK